MIGGEPCFTFGGYVDADDVEYRVEASSNLLEWETLGGDLVVGTEWVKSMTEKVTVRDSAPLSETGKRFLRVKLEWSEE